MINLSESDIISNWDINSDIVVSICCITYQHENYISQAIDSFLMQKTKFPFEIIIGEDCGSDGTRCILMTYQERFPPIIRVVTSDVNVGANENLLRVLRIAKGKYVALCEGDDFWVSDLKLQIQYDTLQRHPGARVCFHHAFKEDAKTSQRVEINNEVRDIKICETSAPLNQIGQYAPTSSYFFDRDIVNVLPKWFTNSSIGDIFIELYSMNNSVGIYLPMFLSVYRVNVCNSWTDLVNVNVESMIKKNEIFVNCLKASMLDINCSKIHFDKKISLVYFSQAIKCLEARRWADFKISIFNSRSYFPLSFKQYVLYKTRSLPMMLYFVCRVFSLFRY